MEKEIKIKLEELPPRTEKLSLDEVTTVFGGCIENGAICEEPCECCNGNCENFGFDTPDIVLVCK